jgi:iron complex outermembrane receptor protein
VQRLSFSLGAREEGYSGWNGVFTPTFAAGYRLSERFRLRASAGRAFRLPTYTDLYYEQPAASGSPGYQGNPNLKPETAWSYDGGLDWTLSRRVSGTATVFYRNENNDLDYILIPDSTAPNTPLPLIPRTCTNLNIPGCVFQAANLQTLSFTGVEASVRWQVTDNNRVVFAYTGLHGAQQALNGLVSLYVFNYPVNNGSMQWQSRLPGSIEMRTRVGVTERYNNDAYALWDLAFSRPVGRLRPYLQFANLGNTSYAERPDVLMPGRTIIGGMELVLTREDLAKKNVTKK